MIRLSRYHATFALDARSGVPTNGKTPSTRPYHLAHDLSVTLAIPKGIPCLIDNFANASASVPRETPYVQRASPFIP